jgi:hypothetical protein
MVHEGEKGNSSSRYIKVKMCYQAYLCIVANMVAPSMGLPFYAEIRFPALFRCTSSTELPA